MKEGVVRREVDDERIEVNSRNEYVALMAELMNGRKQLNGVRWMEGAENRK